MYRKIVITCRDINHLFDNEIAAMFTLSTHECVVIFAAVLEKPTMERSNTTSCITTAIAFWRTSFIPAIA